MSGFIERYMTKNRNHNWGQMKTQLPVRFSDVTDGQMALSLLRQCKQKSGESIHNYAERILSLPETAYDDQGVTLLKDSSSTFSLMGWPLIN